MTLRKKYGAKEFYCYTVTFGEIASGANLAGQFTVDAACDFLWSKSSIQGVTTNGSVDYSFYDLRYTVTDSASGKLLSNGDEYVDTLNGNGGIPFILPTPRLIQGNGSLTVNVYNGTSQAFTAFYFTFIGTQLFAH